MNTVSAKHAQDDEGVGGRFSSVIAGVDIGDADGYHSGVRKKSRGGAGERRVFLFMHGVSYTRGGISVRCGVDL